ncbi:unnamed protein product [Cylicostephanus goldi]|uniref:Uncharacterized protein n=1 Tax=Cylicostephanus goldi TaxID=71465 RepID=A0A3P6TBF5_CYLGO|nr:unnamed protein product [Cylicostephanus goldi]
MSKRVPGNYGSAKKPWIGLSPPGLVDTAADDDHEDRGCVKRGESLETSVLRHTSREDGPSKISRGFAMVGVVHSISP